VTEVIRQTTPSKGLVFIRPLVAGFECPLTPRLTHNEIKVCMKQGDTSRRVCRTLSLRPRADRTTKEKEEPWV
jgi:hypothetical protein